MAYSQPAMLHQFLEKLTSAIATYACHQIDCGAQIIQLFDSWAGELTPEDFQTFALPYLQRLVRAIKAIHPNTPLILYVNHSGGLLELMAQSGVDIVSVDWTVDMAVARQRLGADLGVQGNIDPCILFAPQDVIRQRIVETVRKAGKHRHIFNLGHGVLQKTPEENVAFFFETVKQLNYSSLDLN